MSEPTYVDKKTVNASYRPKSSQMSPGLKRARQPFFLRNALTGVVLTGFAVGVWAYSIGAVKQEDFSDIDEEARALGRSGVQAVEEAKETTVKATEAAAAAGEGGITPLLTSPPAPVVSRVVDTQPSKTAATERPRGIVASLLWQHYPGLFDPATKTLVWGAPPVDKVGKIGDRTLFSQK